MCFIIRFVSLCPVAFFSLLITSALSYPPNPDSSIHYLAAPKKKANSWKRRLSQQEVEYRGTNTTIRTT